MSSTRFLALAVASVVLSQLALAQTLPSTHVPGEVSHLALDLATGEIALLESPSDATVSGCYSNSSSSGSYAVPPVGQEYVDWGTKGCDLHGLVSEVTFGYGTTALDPRAGGRAPRSRSRSTRDRRASACSATRWRASPSRACPARRTECSPSAMR